MIEQNKLEDITKKEKQRIATLVNCPELFKQVLPQLKENGFQLDASKWIYNKVSEHYALHKTIPSANVLNDYCDNASDDISAIAAKELLRDIDKIQTPEDMEYFKGDLLEKCRNQYYKSEFLRIAETNQWDEFPQILIDAPKLCGVDIFDAARFDFKNVRPKNNTDDECLLNDWALERGGSMMLNAQTGVGKSTISYQAGVHWSAGLSTMGFDPHKVRRILLIQNEDNTNTMAIQHQGATQYMTPSQLQLVDSNYFPYQLKGIQDKEFFSVLRQLCEKHNPDIIIINPISRYFGGDEISNRDVGQFTNELDLILKNFNCGGIYIHHTKKQSAMSKKEGLFAAYSARGAAKWGDNSRETLSVETTTDCNVLKIIPSKRPAQWQWHNHTSYIQKGNDYKMPFWTSLDNEASDKVSVNDAKKDSSIFTKRDILNAIPTGEESAITMSDIMTETGISKPTVIKYIKLLLADNEVCIQLSATGNTETLSIGRTAKRYYRPVNT